MATTTVPDHDHDDHRTTAPKRHHRDDYRHLETLDQLALIHDPKDKLTPIDVLFNTKEASAKPKGEPRKFL
jgi:hypothetical protein